MHDAVSWRLLRLEHAPTRLLTAGSPVRVYLLRVPLGGDHRIDIDTHANDPRLCSMRRFWPSEKDRSGHIERGKSRWHLVSVLPKGAKEAIGWFNDCTLELAARVQVHETRGGAIPFDIVDARPA